MACLSFATSSAHEHKIACNDYLSVEYLFYHAVSHTPGRDSSAGTSMAATAVALRFDGQPSEAGWPYAANQPTPWAPPPIDGAIYRAAMSVTQCSVTDIVTFLDQGSPVVLGLVITDAFRMPGALGLVPDITNDIERGGHAVLAVGYGRNSASDLMLLVRNSWGPNWGQDGHAWLSRNYVTKHLYETAVLV